MRADAPLSRGVLLLAVGLVAALGLPLLLNPGVHMRADAMSNTAICHAIERHGLPPKDPYIAGQPLYYYWAYNVLVAGIRAVTGVHPLAVMVVLGPVALLVMLVSVARLVHWLGGDNRGAALAVLLVVFGLNGYGWLILASRWLGGQVGVQESLRRGVSPYLHSVVWGYDMRIGFFTTKALLSTSFIWTLAFLPVALGGLLRFRAGEGRRHGLAFVLASAAACYANLLVGGAFVLLLAAGLLGQAGAARRWGSGTSRGALQALLLPGASLLITLPYFLATTGGPAAQERLVALAVPDGFHLRGMCFGLLPLLIGAAATRRPKGHGARRAFLAFLAAGFVLAHPLTRIVDGNQYKFPFASALLLSLWIGARVPRRSSGRFRVLVLAVALAAPTTGLGLLVHARAPGLVTSAAERATYTWIAAHTPPDTVLVSRHRATAAPIYARRDLYVPDILGFHRGARYDKAEWARRQALMRRLDRGEHVAVLQQIEDELGRPVLWVTRSQRVRPNAPRLRRLYASGNVEVWALRDSPHRNRPRPQRMSIASP